MTVTDIVWSELFADEDLDPEFDYERRGEAPWFGFVPRVLGLDLRRPFAPEVALWRDGALVETRRLAVDRRRWPGKVKPFLVLAERFADYCRERNLFGAYLATYDYEGDPARAAVLAMLLREADWCGMFLTEPRPRPARAAGPAAVALEVACALLAGELLPAQPVVNPWPTAELTVTSPPDNGPRSLPPPVAADGKTIFG